ncbi:MAG: phosphatidate cytidylyltransferase [Alphaproteobacteria bacterium]|nr:phosphatidate cytidylyltransferase [Alphaproteobacteria bacterium]MBU0859952.1 phosphatidate cytidylyltransferase [Alphaproteobacteria bacterium]
MNKDLRIRILSGLVLAPLSGALIIGGGWFFGAFIVIGLIPALYEWLKMSEDTPRQYLMMALGVFYIAMTFGSYVFLRFGFEQGAWLSLGIILCVWASDIGAYFTGKKLGGPKLAPKISPKKTWSGFAGAVFCSGIAMMILVALGPHLERFFPTDMGLEPDDVWAVFIIGCAMGAVGQAGDLLISALKRRKGMKDAGSLIPGHGGILDRIDSLMLVSLVFTLVVVACL